MASKPTTAMSTPSLPPSAHHGAHQAGRRALVRRGGLGAALLLAAQAGLAQDAVAPDVRALADRITALARDGARQAAAPLARVEVEVGSLDPRLKLAALRAHRTLSARWPAGLGPHPHRAALRRGPQGLERQPAGDGACVGPLAGDHGGAGHRHGAGRLAPGRGRGGPGRRARARQWANVAAAVGRTLARPLPAGAALRQPDLKSRQWFAAGEMVKLVAVGPGWRIVTEGQAVTPGLEGQPARVRTDNGRVVQGRPVADREVEVTL